VVGETRDGKAPLELPHQVNPDVMVRDVNLPKVNGIMATRQDGLPDIKIIGLSVDCVRAMP